MKFNILSVYPSSGDNFHYSRAMADKMITILSEDVDTKRKSYAGNQRGYAASLDRSKVSTTRSQETKGYRNSLESAKAVPKAVPTVVPTAVPTAVAPTGTFPVPSYGGYGYPNMAYSGYPTAPVVPTMHARHTIDQTEADLTRAFETATLLNERVTKEKKLNKEKQAQIVMLTTQNAQYLHQINLLRNEQVRLMAENEQLRRSTHHHSGRGMMQQMEKMRADAEEDESELGEPLVMPPMPQMYMGHGPIPQQEMGSAPQTPMFSSHALAPVGGSHMAPYPDPYGRMTPPVRSPTHGHGPVPELSVSDNITRSVDAALAAKEAAAAAAASENDD